MGKTEAARRLTVVVCEPGKPPKLVTEEGDTLSIMQAHVGGNIEKLTSFAYMGPVVVDVYLNEDGMALQLPPNRIVRVRGVGYPLLGTVILVGADEANGETLSLESFEGLTDFAMRLAKSFPAFVQP